MGFCSMTTLLPPATGTLIDLPDVSDAPTLRVISKETYDAIVAGNFNPITLVELFWGEEVIQVCSAKENLEWNGTWLGVGGFGSVSLPNEQTSFASFRATFTLTGLSEDILPSANEANRGGNIEVYTAIVDAPQGVNLIGEPFLVWQGYVDSLSVSMQPDLTFTATLVARSSPIARTSGAVLHTPEDQEALFPGDTGGRLLPNASTSIYRLRWPSPALSDE